LYRRRRPLRPLWWRKELPWTPLSRCPVRPSSGLSGESTATVTVSPVPPPRSSAIAWGQSSASSPAPTALLQLQQSLHQQGDAVSSPFGTVMQSLSCFFWCLFSVNFHSIVERSFHIDPCGAFWSIFYWWLLYIMITYTVWVHVLLSISA
jgi:hypothetical protein